MTEPPDRTLDVLLDLDGQVFVVDPEGGHAVGQGVASEAEFLLHGVNECLGAIDRPHDALDRNRAVERVDSALAI